MMELQTITLYFKRADGKREKGALTVHNLREAQHCVSRIFRRAVRRIFRRAPGLDREVEIRIMDRFIETIKNTLVKVRPHGRPGS